jgi:hypothetical protein
MRLAAKADPYMRQVSEFASRDCGCDSARVAFTNATADPSQYLVAIMDPDFGETLAVEKEYEFEGPKGKAGLLDLFDGRHQLIVYRAFFEPGDEPHGESR